MDDRPVEGLIEQKPKKRGCFFWGCLTAGILVLAMGGCVGVGFYMLRERMTSPAPQPIPVYEPKPGEYEGVKERLAGFDKAAQDERPARIELTADDLNALVAHEPELKGKAFIRIEGEKVILDLSIPLDKAPMPFLKGRWLNATVGLKVSLADGRLVLIPESATINQKELEVSGNFLTQFQTKDLLQHVQDEKFREFVRKAKSLEVRDGKIIIGR